MSKRGNKEGSIFKITKNGKQYWVCQVHLGYRENGKPHRKRILRKTMREAQEALMEINRQIGNGTFIHSSKVGFNEWVKDYLESYNKTKVRATTYDHYESLARNHIYPAFANLLLQEVKANFIQHFLAEKAQTLSPSSVQKLRLILNMALQQAVKEELVNKNPVSATSAPRMKAAETEPLSEENLKALLSVAKEHRLYHALALAVSTGMRRGELLGLQWQDIDFTRGTVRIVRNFVKTKAGDVFQEPKTRASRRTINIPEEVLKLLQEAKAKSLPANPWVIPVETQRKSTEYLPVSPRNFSRTYETWCKKAGIENVKIHTLRHTYASHAILLNISMKEIQAQLGHSDVKVTLNTYSHILDGMQQEAARKMNEKLLTLLPSKNIPAVSETAVLH